MKIRRNVAKAKHSIQEYVCACMCGECSTNSCPCGSCATIPTEAVAKSETSYAKAQYTNYSSTYSSHYTKNNL